MDPRALGKTLQRAREDAGLEQSEAAEKLGVHYTTISRWENGRQKVPEAQLKSMVNLYGITPSVLAETGLVLSDDAANYVARETWEPNPSLANVLPPRVYEVAIGYCRRLAAAGLPREEVEEAERLLIDEGYAKLNKRAKRVLTEDEQIELIDATWRIMREALSWRGLRA